MNDGLTTIINLEYEPIKSRDRTQLKDDAERVREGDLSQVEEMLINQAMSLQVLYTRLVERAMSQSLAVNTDLFLKFALRAQSQSRMALEALAAVKNPPVVIARQANISQGPQQINNGILAREENSITHTEVLEHTDGKRLDTRTPEAAIRDDSPLEALGSVHRAKDD